MSSISSVTASEVLWWHMRGNRKTRHWHWWLVRWGLAVLLIISSIESRPLRTLALEVVVLRVAILTIVVIILVILVLALVILFVFVSLP